MEAHSTHKILDQQYATSVEAWKTLYDDPGFGGNQRRKQFSEITQYNESLCRLYIICESLKKAVLREDSKEIELISNNLFHLGCSPFALEVICALVDHATQQLVAAQDMAMALREGHSKQRELFVQTLNELHNLVNHVIQNAQQFNPNSYITSYVEDTNQFLSSQQQGPNESTKGIVPEKDEKKDDERSSTKRKRQPLLSLPNASILLQNPRKKEDDYLPLPPSNPRNLQPQ